ncbi:hypothetical protein POTOM_051105 [Populus tomentosa]|uniref:phosphoglycolate phosphatase n=1 Tax=Populus tomentosa TaxID=118781 RepID=A0A8X7YFK4_POPTO|nr:hypothetical protein POTOM_051105 [Populus tomentosa]
MLSFSGLKLVRKVSDSKYMSDPSHVLEVHPIDLRDDMVYEVQPEAIIDRQVRKLRSKDIASVKVKWKGHSREEATWELEDKMREEYPHLFDNLDAVTLIFVQVAYSITLKYLPRSSCKLHRMNTAKRAAQLLSTQNIRSLFDSVEAFLFDCDGVIWKGDKLIDGVSQTLDWLRSKGKKLVFVTNNSLKSRIQYAKKFHSLGISVAEDEIFSSSFAAAMYLKVNNFPQEKKVYVIGGEGILEELQLAGYTGLGGPVGAVVVGIDPSINYYKLQYGTLCIRENPGCLFIATNRDAVGHMTDLQEWPGAGCMVAAMCGSTEREPIVVGKPSTFIMDFLLQKFHINTSKMCMVGDRLDTDILFGQNAGCKTLLVLSGVTTQTTLQDPSNSVQPDYYTSQVSDLLHLLGP